MMLLSGMAGSLMERLARRPAIARGLGATAGGLGILLGIAWLVVHARALRG